MQFRFFSLGSSVFTFSAETLHPLSKNLNVLNSLSIHQRDVSASVLPDRVDDFQPKSSPKPAHFNKNQPKILTANIMWYDFITMSIKINKDHFYLLKIK